MNSMLDVTRPPASSSYGFHCVLPKQDFTHAVAGVTLALKAEGFGVLTEITPQQHEERKALLDRDAPQRDGA